MAGDEYHEEDSIAKILRQGSQNTSILLKLLHRAPRQGGDMQGVKRVGLPRKGALLTHGWRFEYPYLPGMDPTDMAYAYEDTIKKAPVVVRPPKIKKSPEERKAIRERRIMQDEKSSLHDVQTALRKNNRTNSTTFELDEITVKCLFFEFGDPGYQYNFTAKPDSHPSAGGNSNLFFAEMNYPLQSEDDVLLCCIVGEKDAGHCHACEDYRPTMIHPSSRAYGGGNTTAIDYPDEDSSSSDSDY